MSVAMVGAMHAAVPLTRSCCVLCVLCALLLYAGACIMSVASFEVIQESVSVLLLTYTTGQLPQLDLGVVMYVVLGSATLLKCLCWAVCAALQGQSDSMLALAEVRGVEGWGCEVAGA